MEHRKTDIHKAAGIIIRDRRLLVSRSKNKDFFVAPGGKLEGDETAERALIRELYEEQGIVVEPADIALFGTFYGIAKGHEAEQLTIRMDVFTVKSCENEPSPHNEIAENCWVDAESGIRMDVGSIFVHDVIPRLKAEGLID